MFTLVSIISLSPDFDDRGTASTFLETTSTAVGMEIEVFLDFFAKENV